MKLEIELKIHGLAEFLHLGSEIIRRLNSIDSKQEEMMATLDQVLQDVSEESSVIDSIGTLVTGLRQQLADALSGANLPAPVQAKVDAIFAAAESNKQKLAAAVTENTPVAGTDVTATP